MGDVVLLLPVIRALVASHPDVEVTVATRPKFAPFFYDIERVTVFPADVDYTYNGAFGMPELFRTLTRKARFDLVIDAHDHLRTKLLRTFFRVAGVPVVVFDKGRKEKTAFSRRRNKVITPLPHTVERYRKAFEKAGLGFDVRAGDHFTLNASLEAVANEWLEKNSLQTKEGKWIGVAPFALHATKVWPPTYYAELMENLIGRLDVKFFLFGGGEKEIAYFKGLEDLFPQHCVVVAGQLKIRQEVALMKKLDLMVCVDSSNMHLASLAGVPLLSIWGGTHSDVGFGPFGRGDESIIQISRDELPCRPCSVYGREYCYVGGFPCLKRITPARVADRVVEKIG